MTENTPGFRPLYQQVYDFIVKQLLEGAWKPGEALPSEQALAGQLHVSQGTVRKALFALSQEQLLERRQGKGTFVATHTQDASLFRFFRLTRVDGTERGVPTSHNETVTARKAEPHEAAKLDLAPGAKVFEIKRTRFLDGVPVIFETVVVSAARFAGLNKHADLPNALYQLYQRQYQVNVVATNEELRAGAATAEDAERLQVKKGAPLLVIERVAIALDGSRVELRTSRCDTRRHVYAVTLR